MDKKRLRYADRLAVCQACEFYKDGWCGTPVVGHDVMYDGKVQRLCGCRVQIKAALPFMSCPLGKWVANLDDTEREQAWRLVVHFYSTGEVDPKLLAALYNKAIPGSNKGYTTCGSCIKSTIDELHKKLKEHDAAVLSPPPAEAERNEGSGNEHP